MVLGMPKKGFGTAAMTFGSWNRPGLAPTPTAVVDGGMGDAPDPAAATVVAGDPAPVVEEATAGAEASCCGKSEKFE